MTRLMVEPKNKRELLMVEKVLEALKVKFKEEEEYNPEFVAKILKSREDSKNGETTRVKKEDLQSFLGL